MRATGLEPASLSARVLETRFLATRTRTLWALPLHFLGRFSEPITYHVMKSIQ